MLIEKATTGSSAQGNVFWDHYSIACQKGLSLILSIWPGKDLFGCICHFAHFAHSCLKPIWDVKIISRVEAHAGFYLALNLALHPKLHEWPQHLSFSCWFSEGVYLRHSFCFSSGEGQSLRGLQSDMYNIHRHIHCICLRLLIHDLDSLDTYCSLAPKCFFSSFCLYFKPNQHTKWYKSMDKCHYWCFYFQKINQRCLAVQHQNRSKYYHLTFLPSLPPIPPTCDEESAPDLW